jgi:hypothetical protein
LLTVAATASSSSAPSDLSFAHDKERRNVFTWRPGSSDDCEWEVEILGDDEVRLKDRCHQEYLFAAQIEYDRERRHAFTWMPDKTYDESATWKLK